MKLALLLFIAAAAAAAALRTGVRSCSRRAALAAAGATIVGGGPLSASARFSEEAKQAAQDLGFKAAAPKEIQAAEEAPPNAAELKLQALLAKNIEEKEKALGFKFEADDIAEVETILRNKYCGKAGLFGSMPGGTCREETITAAYCSKDVRFSSFGGCDEELGIQRKPGAQNLFKGPPPKKS